MSSRWLWLVLLTACHSRAGSTKPAPTIGGAASGVPGPASRLAAGEYQCEVTWPGGALEACCALRTEGANVRVAMVDGRDLIAGVIDANGQFDGAVWTSSSDESSPLRAAIRRSGDHYLAGEDDGVLLSLVAGCEFGGASSPDE